MLLVFVDCHCLTGLAGLVLVRPNSRVFVQQWVITRKDAVTVDQELGELAPLCSAVSMAVQAEAPAVSGVFCADNLAALFSAVCTTGSHSKRAYYIRRLARSLSLLHKGRSPVLLHCPGFLIPADVLTRSQLRFLTPTEVQPVDVVDLDPRKRPSVAC